MVKLQDYKGTDIEKAFLDSDINKAWSPQARAAALVKRLANAKAKGYEYNENKSGGSVHSITKDGKHIGGINLNKDKTWYGYNKVHKTKEEAMDAVITAYETKQKRIQKEFKKN